MIYDTVQLIGSRREWKNERSEEVEISWGFHEIGGQRELLPGGGGGL